MKYEFNVAENILDVREMTSEEVKQDKKNQTDLAKKLATIKSEIEAKESARQVILNRLGITAEEAAILLG